MSGQHNGKKAFIPRIICKPSPGELPFVLKRRQFPVCLCFGMTINKSQGQSVKHVGIDLRNPVFAHGQLYVAGSRCTSSSRIKVVFPPETNDCTTDNIVYPEVLQ
jgi:ATP-dependent exoDNAse (exonuclease V) alpha subunit